MTRKNTNAKSTTSKTSAKVIGKGKFSKTCTKSGVTYKATTQDGLAEFFYRDKSQKDKLAPWSKDAEREYNKAYRAGLTAAKVAKKSEIDTTSRAGKAAAKKFEAAMAPERVERKRNTGRMTEAKAKASA